jgi:ketosteroid isomerase-like protein
MKFVADEVRPMGPEHAVEIGHSQYEGRDADGNWSPGTDNYVVVWHKSKDGVWYYVTDIFNSR